MRSTLALIFFLSGASALIFESLWFRLAGLSLGNSVWSASLVLAAFMGGLALGNGLVARLHRRVLHPVRLYAALEFAIGIGGIAVVLLLPRLPNLLGPALGSLTDMPVLLNAVRLTIAFGILVTPAIAMGATLPVLAQALSRQDPNFGANIGWLYGWNTLGAMLAAFSTELFLVPAFGILNSGLFALVFNLMAALIALRFSQIHETAPMPGPSAADVPQLIGIRSRRYVAVAFLSGALMLALEVVWFRFLLLTRDGTSLIFAVMLAVVLAGIAVGGLAAARLFQRDDRAYRWLRHVTATSAALVVLTYWGYDLFSVYRDLQDTTTLAFIGFATFLMFPVAVLSGVAFTMVNRAVKDDFGSSARTAGIATFFNTIGAMLGSLFAGFILLPMAGMESSFFLIAATYCLVTFVVPLEDQTSRLTILGGRGAVAGAVACLILFPFGLMQKTYFGAQLVWLPTHELVATREGLIETLRYYRQEVFGEPKYYRLVTNGFSMSATTTAAKRYMKLYVYLPLAFKPDTRDALLISFGVGSTAKALTDSPGLQNIDVVDISEDILEMSTIIYPGDDNPLRDERVRVHVEDGRFFLNTTTNRYDLITSEPPPPKIAGVVNLYSQEYFKLIHKRLNPGGYASYWLPVQQLEPTDTLAIVKAFCNAFDDCSLWSGAGLEWMLLGSKDANPQRDVTQLSAQWREPQVARELIALGLESPAQLGSLFMADADLLMELTADVAPVTDNYPSRISSRPVINPGYIELYDALMDEDVRLERFRSSELISQLLPAEFKKNSEPFFQYERLIKNHFTAGVYRHQNDPFVWEAIDDLLTNTSLTTLPLWLLGSDQDTQNIIASLLEQEGYRDDFALGLARKYASERDYESALRYVNNHITTANDVSEWASNFYLYLLAKNGMAAEARPIIAKLETLGRPGVDRFLDWFATKFELNSAESFEPPIVGAQPVT
ncbi:MAG: spermidine synthase [Gammaproteobacteria bacterium]|nr:spermidine synthase [Gammaproteobacteria bacterium]